MSEIWKNFSRGSFANLRWRFCNSSNDLNCSPRKYFCGFSAKPLYGCRGTAPTNEVAQTKSFRECVCKKSKKKKSGQNCWSLDILAIFPTMKSLVPKKFFSSNRCLQIVSVLQWYSDAPGHHMPTLVLIDLCWQELRFFEIYVKLTRLSQVYMSQGAFRLYRGRVGQAVLTTKFLLVIPAHSRHVSGTTDLLLAHWWGKGHGLGKGCFGWTCCCRSCPAWLGTETILLLRAAAG